MAPKHIIIGIVILAALSFVPFYFGDRAPRGTPPITPPGISLPTPPPASPTPLPNQLPTSPQTTPPPTPQVSPPTPTPQAAPTPIPTPTPTPLPTPPPTPPANQSISINNFAFQTPITVRRGTQVTWTNNDSAPHTATSDSAGGFDSGFMGNGGTFSSTFNAVGTFAYHCAFHPSMHGSIVVTE